MKTFKDFINEGEKRDARISKSSNPSRILARLNRISDLLNKGMIGTTEAGNRFSAEAQRAKNLRLRTKA